MNVRAGFHRLSIGVLVISWSIWLALAVPSFAEEAARRGEELFYGLVITVVYMLICKGIAWVFNGFFPPQR